MKFIQIENLSKKEIMKVLKEVKGVSFTVSTKIVNESQWNKFENILPTILASGFKESEQSSGQFGSTKYFTKE